MALSARLAMTKSEVPDKSGNYKNLDVKSFQTI
jgi:hypothetical protein